MAIALREFGGMSDRVIAEMCAVSHKTVAAVRRALDPIGELPQCSTRTTSDERQYPATRKARTEDRKEDTIEHHGEGRTGSDPRLALIYQLGHARGRL